MHQTLIELQQGLRQVIDQMRTTIPNDKPFGNAHNNWSFPGLTRAEMIEDVQSIIDMIEEMGVDELGDHEPRLRDYIRRLQHLQASTVPNIWGNSGAGVSAFFFTLFGLRKALARVNIGQEQVNSAGRLRKVANQIRAMESRLREYEPRTNSLASMLERIEQASNAADQLPIDLESLSEAKEKVVALARDAQRDREHLLEIRRQVDELEKQIAVAAEDARSVLRQCETAYSAATSVGLAAAFSERSKALSYSMIFWIASLAASLAAGSYFGGEKLRGLSELFRAPNVSMPVVIVEFVLALLSVGAPVWFAWLATKQIGQRFRLSEDYAFKASISRAYEGFRREASRVDKKLEAQLLASALTRYDELPLRLVEDKNHGSPWHELVSSDVVRRAIKVVPEFSNEVKELASRLLKSTDQIRKNAE